jgi:hypothetical protein
VTQPIRHLLVVGAQRSGTTYLHSLLEAHPDITMARPSRPEPKVFCDAELSARGVDWYRATYFAHARPDQLLGDKSTSYLEHPEAPARARAVLGQAHVVVLLRDPVERAVSNWQFSTDNGLETRPLETALRENLEHEREWDRGASSVSPFAYLERGRYIDHLTAWTTAFPTTTHVVFLPELVDDETTLKSLDQALGVDPGSRPAPGDRPLNPSHAEAPALSSDLVGRLRSYYQESNRALGVHLGRELPW